MKLTQGLRHSLSAEGFVLQTFAEQNKDLEPESFVCAVPLLLQFELKCLYSLTPKEDSSFFIPDQEIFPHYLAAKHLVLVEL